MRTKILIAGIGGVGGYFGGSLANYYEGSDAVEISFYARGEHLKEIQKKGLRVIKGKDEFIAKPVIASDNADEIGVVDYLIVCTKSYGLEPIIHQLKSCINKDTIILPLLNGVDSREKIKKMLPANVILDGCAYIVARLKQSGIVENIGNIQTLYFGLDNYEDERLNKLEQVFKKAGIEATYSGNITKIIWEKFIFISPTATATSYFNKPIGEVLADNESFETISKLIEEVKQVAEAAKITMPENISEISMNKLRSMPYETTSSMHADFKNNKEQTELDSLTGYVISEAKKYGLEVPTYIKAYERLQNKS